MSNRRDFIKQAGLISAGSLFIPRFLNANALNSNSPRRLVVIQLSGGNDGLNTVVPYRNDDYYYNRPQISVSDSDVLRLDDELGLNPGMSSFRELFDQGYVSIYNNVGYPNPNRSHFRAMDIWQSGLPESKEQTGWLGRYLDHACQGNDLAPAIEIDGSLSLALKGNREKGLAVENPDRFYRSIRDPQISNIAKRTYSGDNDDLNYLYKVLHNVQYSAEYIREHYRKGSSTQLYPANKFGNHLKAIAQLINSKIETKVFYVSLPGFDTHAGQPAKQRNLLKTYSDGVAAFVKDLKRSGEFDNTLILTFSEFGRRVKENGSRGTDHGKANNVFIVGGKLKEAGIINEQPDLNDLDDGDLAFSIDFRQIYSTILDNWLNEDSGKVMKGKFGSLDFV